MEKWQVLPLKVVVYGCLVDELLEVYENGERKFCDRDLADGLKAGDPLQYRIITTTDGEQSFGFAATAHYLLEEYGNEKSQSIAENVYNYAHLTYASCEEADSVVERLEIQCAINEEGKVILANLVVRTKSVEP